MAGLKFVKNGKANGERSLKKYIVDNLKTVQIGDAVHLASGYIDPAAAAERVLGIVVAIVASAESDLAPTSNGAGGDFIDTYTTAADNTTVAQVSVLVDTDPDAIYSAECDATPGTTTNSNLAGFYFDLIDENTIDESDVDASVQQ